MPLKSTTNEVTILKKRIADLQKSEAEIESVTSELKTKLDTIDTMLLQHTAEWSKHRDECFTNLASQLEAQRITLTTEEKAQLRKDSDSITVIQEKAQALQKLNIDLPKKATDFAIITYDVVVAALSRTLQKVDDKNVQKIVKSLSIIDEEEKAASKIKDTHAEQYKTIIDSAHHFGEQLDKISTGLEDQDQELQAGVALYKTELDRSSEPTPE